MDIFENLENLQVSEACFDEIMGIIEEYILELNKYDQYRVDKDPKLKKEIEKRQEALKDIGDDKKFHNRPGMAFRAVDLLADQNREALGRDDDFNGTKISKVSFERPERFHKADPTYKGRRALRTEQSQRGSSKDVWNRMDPLIRKAKGL